MALPEIMKGERWIWIGGWGLPPTWLQQRVKHAFPAAEHSVLPPGPDAVDQIDWRQFDRVGGYSLGAFLLLKQAETVPLPALLLAPFFAYSAEPGVGGKIRQVQLRYLGRWLRREPTAALADFHARAQLSLPSSAELPYSMDDLEWGLQQLADERVSGRFPEGWTGIIGDCDPFLDANELVAAEPRLQVIAGAGHDPTSLLLGAKQG